MKALNLKINNPCTEDWDEMKNESGSRHCSSCKKNVIDFSFMSDEQITAFFKNTTDKICGRFRKEQLQVAYIVPAKRKAPWFNKFFFKVALTGILTLKLADADAQSTTVKKETIKDNSGKQKLKEQKSLPEEKKFIAGRILDQDSREIISNATITFNGTKTKVKCDGNGTFKIDVPKSYKGETIDLTITSPGYDSFVQSFKVADLPRKEWLVLLNYKEQMLMGDVAPDWQDHK
jgi:hypothetical protein